MTTGSDPCQKCGACCAAYRVDFHPVELAGGAFAWEDGVPPSMTVALTPAMVRMLGTDASPPRCVALEGEVGKAVRCQIYPARPSPCREFEPHHAACARARRAAGLPQLDSVG